MHTPFDPSKTPLLEIYGFPRYTCGKWICPKMLVAALFVVTHNRKHPECSSMEEWLNKYSVASGWMDYCAACTKGGSAVHSAQNHPQDTCMLVKGTCRTASCMPSRLYTYIYAHIYSVHYTHIIYAYIIYMLFIHICIYNVYSKDFVHVMHMLLMHIYTYTYLYTYICINTMSYMSCIYNM